MSLNNNNEKPWPKLFIFSPASYPHFLRLYISRTKTPKYRYGNAISTYTIHLLLP